jgi:ribosomal protein S19
MLKTTFNTSGPQKKSFRNPHLGNNTWRQIFLHLSSQVIEEQDKFIHDRASSISPILIASRLKITMGRGYIPRQITPYMVGFKFGELTWNRKIALYKAKQLRKKKKK